ncbi:MAG TPA: hypothetical protein VF679_05820, partial [Pedobacter sp.]
VPKAATIKYGNRVYSAKLSPFYTNFQWLKGGKEAEVTQVSIFQESNSVDSKYLAAAVQSIASYREFRIDIKFATKVTQLKDADLIFWLSSRKLSDEISASFTKQARVFIYAPGKVINLNSFINLQHGSQENGDPSLHKRILGDDYCGNTLWSDYQGTPLLTKETREGRAFYKLYTRLNPNWTSLVWQDQFVRSLIPIVSPEVSPYDDFGYVNVPSDQRQMDIKISNASRKYSGEPSQQSFVKEPLSYLFWIFAFGLFCLERFISLVKRKGLTNG